MTISTQLHKLKGWKKQISLVSKVDGKNSKTNLVQKIAFGIEVELDATDAMKALKGEKKSPDDPEWNSSSDDSRGNKRDEQSCSESDDSSSDISQDKPDDVPPPPEVVTPIDDGPLVVVEPEPLAPVPPTRKTGLLRLFYYDKDRCPSSQMCFLPPWIC